MAGVITIIQRALCYTPSSLLLTVDVQPPRKCRQTRPPRRMPSGLSSHKQQSLDRNHLRRQSETVLWPSAMDEYRITCSKVSVPPRGNTIDWFPLTHTTHHHPQQCRLCRYNRRTQPARPREPSYMHQVTDSPPPAENKLQSSAARQRRSPESHTRRELARVSATS